MTLSTLAHSTQRWRLALMALGIQRLFALAVLCLATLAFLGVGGYYLMRPQMEILYTGLEKEDVSRIGAALSDSGVSFDVNTQGDAVLVPYGQTPRARMLLAEKGLPRSETSGYELFDKMGSMGLTSFMQEVTKVRALEGEISRTLQNLSGVKTARVHLVLSQEGSLRRSGQKPSASVVLGTEGRDVSALGQAVRHLVASAVPSMSPEQVTVLTTDGSLLASGRDSLAPFSGQMLELERTLSQSIEQNIRHTLTPYLGIGHFQVSATADLNTDKKQTKETVFDPNSKVERSIRVVRESENSQNSRSQKPTSAEQNIPNQAANATGDRSSEKTDRKEELTNFEVNSKTVSTISDGYKVDKLSVAVVVDQAKILQSLGEDTSPAALAARLQDIEKLVASAAGIRQDRGDQLTVTALSFTQDDGANSSADPGFDWQTYTLSHMSSLINAATFFTTALLLLLLGIRPITRAFLAPLPPPPSASEEAQASLEAPPSQASLSGPGASAQLGFQPGQSPSGAQATFQKPLEGTQKRLEQLINLDEQQAATVLKQWARS